MIIIHSFLFYTLLYNYIIRHYRKSPKYSAYCNSTINALSVITLYKYNYVLVCKLISGYFLQDLFHVVLNRELYKNNYNTYITHHIVSFFICSSDLPKLYPVISKNMLLLENTVPIGNMIWFAKYYNKNHYDIILKIMFFLSYSYFRIYHTIHMAIISYYGGYPIEVHLFIWCILFLNISWYRTIVKFAYNKAIQVIE